MTENYTSCCFTGYRPDKFPFQLNSENLEYQKFENALFEQILALAENGCRRFYCGMAMGFDLISAETVLAVKNAFSQPLELVCVLPFKSQSYNFTCDWKRRFNEVLKKADKCVILAEKYFSGCYQQRNIFMVDNSDFVITWYDGKKGGTENTIRYALKKGRQVFNINKTAENIGFQTEFIVF